jgi:hypothetical protein
MRALKMVRSTVQGVRAAAGSEDMFIVG